MTDRHGLPPAPQVDPRATLIQRIADVLAAGIDWVQIREKDLSARELAAMTRQAVLLAQTDSQAGPNHPQILVNDRLDVAMASHAGGVHLGESGLPVAQAKRLVALRRADKGFLVGASCHSVESTKFAEAEGADYVIFGPVFATPSKAAFGAPQGLDRLAEACAQVSIPVLAIGGITLENGPACLGAGAAGIAAIRLFQGSPDPAATIKALRQMFR